MTLWRRLATLLLLAPLAAGLGSLLLTIGLVPFWRWLEATTGLESIGHSGPAAWCYWLNFGLLYTGLLTLLPWRRKAAPAHTPCA